ncbi:MAG: hypothetical protein ACX93O_00060 [Flagellimonas sp.]
MGWKKKFGLPSAMTMEVIGIKSYNTYKKTFEDLVEWGFFEVVERSKNQYTANIIALSKIDKAPDKANAKHLIKQDQSTEQSNDSIIKPNKLKNEETKKSSRFSPPSMKEVYCYMIEKKTTKEIAASECQKFVNFYESKNWYVGKNKMSKWKSAVSGWLSRMDSKTENQNNNPTSRIPIG